MSKEEFDHFVSLVGRMRDLQRRWFGGDKTSALLHDAMKAEKAVDKAIADRAAAAAARQPTLWTPDPRD